MEFKVHFYETRNVLVSFNELFYFKSNLHTKESNTITTVFSLISFEFN